MQSFAASPDGRYLAIALNAGGKRQLWLRALDTLQLQPMPGTDGAVYPFWSPDSRYIAFFTLGKLKKIAATGGPAQSLCDSGVPRGGSWGRQDVIVFSSGSPGIKQIPAAGGTPVNVTNTTGDEYPVFLPDGRHFLYINWIVSADKRGIYLGSLDGNTSRRVLTETSTIVFAPSRAGQAGHIVFVRENTLMVQPFDTAKARTSGEVFPIAENVSLMGVANFQPVTVTENGLLIYATGALTSNQLVWYDREGKTLETVGAPGPVSDPSISPDGRSIAFTRQTGTTSDIWTRDLARGTDLRLTSDASGNMVPVWSPGGDRIVFRSNRGGHPGDIYQRKASGSGQDELLLSTPNYKTPMQWSRDGRFIAYSENDPASKWDLWLLSQGPNAASDRKPVPFLHTEFSENQGQISPDGRWMAYTSDESGTLEVYVRPFPAGEGKWKISVSGGEQPRWRGDGKEIFFVSVDGKLMAASVKEVGAPQPSIEPGTPVPLFDTHIVGTPIYMASQYDVTADGKRFLVNTNRSSGSAPALTVVVNWEADLRK
jgi:Tol biopolymer transport system component